MIALAAVLAVAVAAPPREIPAPPDPAPRRADLERYSSLWHQCATMSTCDAPRNVRQHGVRFKWVSRNGKHRHWGDRPADASDIGARTRRLRARIAVTTLTPYAGPGGTRWAIPWYIVACESHGRWDAYNRSGAIGPYQLLGKGAPWPANTPAARLAHHRIASRLWAGGAGAHHWVCS